MVNNGSFPVELHWTENWRWSKAVQKKPRRFRSLDLIWFLVAGDGGSRRWLNGGRRLESRGRRFQIRWVHLRDKVYRETGPPVEGLVMVALAHALALFAAISASINISGGHVNPAVTFGALVGGRISVLRALFYWVAQLLGAVVASLLLRLVTNGMRPVGFHVSSGVGELHGLLMEMVMTFGLVYTVYATAIDPKRGSVGIIAPLAIAFIVGANILVGGPFDGASMNPARAFGPALVGWRWHNHWIYWVGPLIGGALAGLIYEYMVIPTEPPHHHTLHQPLAPEDY